MLIAGDRYHQIWHHGQINESAVFRYSPVSLSDLLPESRSTQEKKKNLFIYFTYKYIIFFTVLSAITSGKNCLFVFFSTFPKRLKFGRAAFKKIHL